MARHKPSDRAVGEPLDNKVRMRRGADGQLVPIFPKLETTETTEAEERPQQPDDPRTAAQRNVPPYGAGI